VTLFLFCMEELCLYFVAELYTLESSNVFCCKTEAGIEFCEFLYTQ
jgi:hypothetical protein